MVGFNASLNSILTQIRVMQPKLGARPGVQSTSSTLQPARQPALQTQVAYIIVSLRHTLLTLLQLNYLLQP